MGRKRTKQEFINELCSIYNINENDFSIDNYTGWDKKLAFTCNKCGQTKEVIAYSLKKKRGEKKNICRCYGYSNDWFNTLEAFNNWKSKQTKYLILEEFKGTTKNILVKCIQCGTVQRRSVKSLLNDERCLCCENKCSILKTEEEFKKELEDLYYGEYSLIGEYKGSDNYTLIKHNNCGKIYKTKPHYLLSNKGGLCPNCRNVSKGERKIISFLKEKGIKYKEQYRLDGFKKAPYDFYLPEYNTLLEFQGIQHYEPVKKFGGHPAFLKQLEIDKKKKLLAEQEGYSFVTISYKDIDKIDGILIQRLSLAKE